jgi:hypothetical protein
MSPKASSAIISPSVKALPIELLVFVSAERPLHFYEMKLNIQLKRIDQVRSYLLSYFLVSWRRTVGFSRNYGLLY